MLQQTPAAPPNSCEPLDTALQNWEQAIALKPDWPEAYHACGNIQLELKRYGDALASFDKAIELKADYSPAYNGLGNALQALRRFNEAVETYDNAIAFKADYAARQRTAIVGTLSNL